MKKLFFSAIYFLTIFSASSQSCQDNEVVLQFNTGDWASEVSWSITDSLGNLIDSTSQNYVDSTTYYDTICLINGCYNFNMFDTWGDGWQGGSYQLSDSLGNIVSYGNLEGYFSFGSNMFSVNSTSCPVLGCTLPSAVNYNPIATVDDSSCLIISDNINLLFNWSNSTLPINSLAGSYSDVYGLAINGGEYAVIGSTMGAHIIDVTNPSQSYEAAFVPGAFQGSLVTHRDYFHMDNYLYAVCDQGTSTLQIIDLSNLPNSVNVVYDTDSLISRSHNMFIDTINKKLYSTNGTVLDISNPIHPTFLFDMGFSCHDLYVENDTGYFNCTSNGLKVYDMTTNTPQFLGGLMSYPDQGTNHSGWKEDNTYVFADENHGLSLKVIDVSDLSNLLVTALFSSGVDANSIAHNLIIRDNFVYVSYYHDGLQIFDISDPYNPIKAGYYDTYLPNNYDGYAGNWGVDPQLPSGIILVSDVQSGLFVLDFNYNEESICDGDSLLFDTSYVYVDGFHISNTFDSLGYSDIIVTELSTVPTSSSTQSISICDGEYITIGNSTYGITGNYTDTLVNLNGCDSIVFTDLNILPLLVWEWDTLICEGENIIVGNNVYDVAGFYIDTLVSSNGCDSVEVYTDISIKFQTVSFDTIFANSPINWNNQVLSESGDYSFVLMNSVGCDSIVNLNLNLENTSGILDFSITKKLIYVGDVLGRKAKGTKNNLLFYIYDDGTVEKRIIIE